MPIYVCKVISPQGLELTREAAASSEAELKRELENQGFLLRDARPKGATFFSLGGQRVKPEDLLQCNQELATLLKAGLTVPEALDISSDRPENQVLSSTLQRVLQDVKNGSSLSSACAKYPLVFDGLFLASLKTGEKTGNLAAPLSRYQEYLTQKIAIQNKVSQALVYPLFLLAVLAGVMTLLFAFVMPRFAALYADFHAPLPLATRVLMIIVRHLYLVASLLAGGGLTLWITLRIWTSRASGRFWMDEAKRRLPWVSRFTQPFLLSQFARTLSTLLSGGTPLVEALKVSRDSMTNVAYADRLSRVIDRVMEGEDLSQAVSLEGLMPRSAIKLIEVGEASGQLEQILEEITRSAERLLENRVQRVMTLIEPVFILLTGLLIGAIIVVMYLPIIHLTDIVK